MNIYDTRTIRCVTCDRCIGEIDYDAEVRVPKCGYCAHHMPAGDDKLSYTASSLGMQTKAKRSMVMAR